MVPAVDSALRRTFKSSPKALRGSACSGLTMVAQGIRLTPAEYDRQVDGRRIQIAFHAHGPLTAGGDPPALLESQPGANRGDLMTSDISTPLPNSSVVPVVTIMALG
jgi:hypothetical protein